VDNWETEAIREYHERTKHSYISVRMAGHGIDWSNKPYPFKVYLDAPKILLREEFATPRRSLYEALIDGPCEVERVVDIALLSELLFYTAGITRIRNYNGERVYFRAAPATGALHETELYVVAGRVEGLEPGVYHFDPCEFALDMIRVGDYRSYLADAIGVDGAKGAELLVIMSSVGWRNAWKYGERSYRHWFWDGGAMYSNLLAVALAESLRPMVVLGFIDSAVNRLIGVDGASEAAIAVVVLEGGRPYPSPPSPYPQPIKYTVMPYSRREIVYDLIVMAHKSSELKGVEELLRWREALESIGGSRGRVGDYNRQRFGGRVYPPLGDVILLRGSTRRFSRERIPQEYLKEILSLSHVPIKSDFLTQRVTSLLNTYLIINSVEGVRPGVYRYEAASGDLHPLRIGDYSRTASYLCLEQELAGDASAVVFFTTDLETVLKAIGNRGYRAAQFEAGVRVGLAYLAAYSLGIGASGLTFYDDDVSEFLSAGSGGIDNMMVVALGKPAYTAKPGKIHVASCKHP